MEKAVLFTLQHQQMIQIMKLSIIQTANNLKPSIYLNLKLANSTSCCNYTEVMSKYHPLMVRRMKGHF